MFVNNKYSCYVEIPIYSQGTINFIILYNLYGFCGHIQLL